MLFFGKSKKKNQKLDDAFDKVYQEISTIENWEDPKKLEHYILDSCEQIIGLTKEIEGDKAEYRIVTAYLKDIQTIEKMPEEKRNDLREVAAHIEELQAAKASYANVKHQITESQFLLMEQEEETVPDTIRRLLDNERYLDATKRDKQVLEAQKHQWEIEREDIRKKSKWLRNVSMILTLFYAMLLILLFVIQQFSTFDLTIAFLLLFFVGGVGAFLIYLFSSKLGKDRKKALRNMNQAISLLNVVLMKYANAVSAVEYTTEKFQVHSSTELNYVWEQYVDAVKQKERLLKNNDDLEFFSGRLMRILQKEPLYDRKIWLNQTKALVDADEMVEIRHNLVHRRQKIREHIEENRRIVRSERDEIDRLMTEHDHYVPEIIEIIQSVDKLCGLKKRKTG